MKALVPAALMAAFSFVTTAQAQQTCGVYHEIAAGLKEQYGESKFADAMSGGNMVQFWRSEETGSWTVLVVRPDGVACLLAAGDYFDFAAPDFDPAANNSL